MTEEQIKILIEKSINKHVEDDFTDCWTKEAKENAIEGIYHDFIKIDVLKSWSKQIDSLKEKYYKIKNVSGDTSTINSLIENIQNKIEKVLKS